MLGVACFLLVLAIHPKFQFEPLLLLPIAFGMLLANLPGAGIYHAEFWDPSNTAFWDAAGHINAGQVLKEGGLLDILYLGGFPYSQILNLRIGIVLIDIP